MSEFNDFYRLLSEVSCFDNGLYVGELQARSVNELSLLSEDEYDTLFLPPPSSNNNNRRRSSLDNDQYSVSSSDEDASVGTATKTTTTTTTIWQQPQRQRRIIDQQQNNIDNVRNEISSLRMSQRLSILEADPEEFRRIKAEFKKSGMTTAMGAMQFLDQQMMTQNINLAACRSHD